MKMFRDMGRLRILLFLLGFLFAFGMVISLMSYLGYETYFSSGDTKQRVFYDSAFFRNYVGDDIRQVSEVAALSNDSDREHFLQHEVIIFHYPEYQLHSYPNQRLTASGLEIELGYSMDQMSRMILRNGDFPMENGQIGSVHFANYSIDDVEEGEAFIEISSSEFYQVISDTVNPIPSLLSDLFSDDSDYSSERMAFIANYDCNSRNTQYAMVDDEIFMVNWEKGVMYNDRMGAWDSYYLGGNIYMPASIMGELHVIPMAMLTSVFLPSKALVYFGTMSENIKWSYQITAQEDELMNRGGGLQYVIGVENKILYSNVSNLNQKGEFPTGDALFGVDVGIIYHGNTGEWTEFYYDGNRKYREKTGQAATLQVETPDTEENGVSFIVAWDFEDNDHISVSRFLFPFSRLIPHATVFLVISTILFLTVMVLLMILTGAVEKEGKRIFQKTPFEKIGTEAFLILGGLAVLVLATGISFAGKALLAEGTYLDLSSFTGWLSGLLGFLSCFAVYSILAEFCFSFVRRLKTKCFFTDMLPVKAMKKLSAYGKRRKWFILLQWILFLGNVGMAVLLIHYRSVGEWAILFGIFMLLADYSAVRWLIHHMDSLQDLVDAFQKMKDEGADYRIPPEKKEGLIREIAEEINSLGEMVEKASFEASRSERMKVELITNVSHDIKTPLTTIINYVDLLKKENLPKESRAAEYVDVLDKKSQRLKQLILDLIDASRAASGDVELDCAALDFEELVRQAMGESEEQFREHRLDLVSSFAEGDMNVLADGRYVHRIIDNLLQNVVRYAREDSRVYTDMKRKDGYIVFTMKNMSRDMLNVSPEELTERFVRGDSSRTTEGSGLGLSIAQSLTELMKGVFRIEIDGDLFKVMVSLPVYARVMETEPCYEVTFVKR